MKRAKKDISPKVTVRKSAMHPESSKIIEVSAPDGKGLLIEVYTLEDGSLNVRPYRADVGVALKTGNSEGWGASLRYDSDKFIWVADESAKA